MQRRLLRRADREAYDDQWGLDPTGEFVRRDVTHLGGFLRREANAEHSIRSEIKVALFPALTLTVPKTHKLNFTLWLLKIMNDEIYLKFFVSTKSTSYICIILYIIYI